MFWGSFAGTKAGPYIFRENQWGNITAQSYFQQILPQLVYFIGSNQENLARLVMHDNARVHTAAITKDYFRQQGSDLSLGRLTLKA